jgi:hypothetical protein
VSRYVVATYPQILALAALVAALTAGPLAWLWLRWDRDLLPEVVRSPAGDCLRVVNYENGHAFTCPDVDVVLRRYRVTSEAAPPAPPASAPR